jgi:glucose/arabinose dehydrogenase
LNLSDRTAVEEGADWGLHGFAFSTDGSRLYVSFTNLDARTQVLEFRVSNGRVSPTSERTLLEIENRDRVHNAGPITVGADGYLHITLGDMGESGDPHDVAQNPESFAGSTLRIDPETGGENPYNIPPGNPYVGGGPANGRDEVYLIGVRDPAGIFFDPLTRDGWLLDTGEDGQQEVNYLRWEGEALRGGNLGWPLMNGIEPFDAEEPIADDIEPIWVYGPQEGCQIVGGATYYGNSIPGLDSAYIFGDRCSGKLIAIKVDEGEIVDFGVLGVTIPPNELSVITTTPDGEIVIITETGFVYQLVYLPPPDQPIAPS